MMASAAQNGGVTFSHTAPADVRRRQMLERFQVRTCTGAPVIETPRAASSSAAQSRSQPMPPGLGVAETVRVREQGVAGPGPELQVRGPALHLGQIDDPTARGPVGIPGHLEDAQHPDLETEHVAGRGHHVLDVTPPGARQHEGSGRAEQLASGGAEHQRDLGARHDPRP